MLLSKWLTIFTTQHPLGAIWGFCVFSRGQFKQPQDLRLHRLNCSPCRNSFRWNVHFTGGNICSYICCDLSASLPPQINKDTWTPRHNHHFFLHERSAALKKKVKAAALHTMAVTPLIKTSMSLCVEDNGRSARRGDCRGPASRKH